MNFVGRDNHRIPAMHPVAVIPADKSGTTGQDPDYFHDIMNMGAVCEVMFRSFGKVEIMNK
jgi:hypothetical protein